MELRLQETKNGPASQRTQDSNVTSYPTTAHIGNSPQVTDLKGHAMFLKDSRVMRGRLLIMSTVMNFSAAEVILRQCSNSASRALIQFGIIQKVIHSSELNLSSEDDCFFTGHKAYEVQISSKFNLVHAIALHFLDTFHNNTLLIHLQLSSRLFP